MRRTLSLCASTLLAAGMVMAQTSSPAAPPPQDQNATASQDPNATKPPDRSAAKPSDTTAGADQNAAAATTDNSKSKPDPNAPARAESPDAAAPNPTNAARDTRGDAPWLWVVLGAVALIALLSLLGGRGPAERGDRVTPIDRTREYHRRIDDRDDVRKAG